MPFAEDDKENRGARAPAALPAAVETSAASNNAPSPVNVKELAEAVRAAPRTRLEATPRRVRADDTPRRAQPPETAAAVPDHTAGTADLARRIRTLRAELESGRRDAPTPSLPGARTAAMARTQAAPSAQTARLAERVSRLAMVEASPAASVSRRIRAMQRSEVPTPSRAVMAPLPSLFDLPATPRPGCGIVPSLELDEDPLLSAIDATLNRPIHAAAPLAVELDGDVDPDAVVATPSPLRRRSNSATPALLAVTPTVKAAPPAPAPAAVRPPVAGRSVPRKPRRLYGRYVLRVVSPSGATLSETEVVRSPLPCLFSMEQGRTLAASGHRPLAHAVLRIMGADRRCTAHAAYWITLAHLHEAEGNYSSVVEAYKQATLTDAKPLMDLQLGLRWFLTRMQQRTDAERQEAAKCAAEASAMEVPQALPCTPPKLSPIPEDLWLDAAAGETSPEPPAAPADVTIEAVNAKPCQEEAATPNPTKRAQHPTAPRQTAGRFAEALAQLEASHPSSLRANDTDDDDGDISSLARWEPMRAGRQLRQELGTDKVITPMRRSQRPRHLSSRLDMRQFVVPSWLPTTVPPAKPSDGGSLDAILDASGYAYAPNPALIGSLVATPARPKAKAGRSDLAAPHVQMDNALERASSVASGQALLQLMSHRGAAKASTTSTEPTPVTPKRTVVYDANPYMTARHVGL